MIINGGDSLLKSTIRILREPVVQFLLIGAATFGAYLYLDRAPPEPPREIVQVGAGRIAQISEIFARTWQRPPTEKELQGLVEAFVKEEIYYREGRKLGLDQDDTIFRRRLQQKMEFLVEPDEQEMIPDEGELAAWLEKNRQNYVVPYRASFRQVYFDPARRDGEAMVDARALLSSLEEEDVSTGNSGLGDATMLPRSMAPSGRRQIEALFGPKFASALKTLPLDAWSGPVRSDFGVHLVRLNAFEPERQPGLDEIREIVLRDWRDERRRKIAEQRYHAMKENYEVIVDWPQGSAEEARQ